MKPSHVIVLIVVLLIVFGSSKLPEIARSIGQSAKVMKKELRELQDDDPKQLPPSQAGQQPGTQQPGTQQPGMQQPGTHEPGTQQPGPEQPGANNYPQQDT
ncbi:twin-arginine translocase TatA/TatE family subunit [Trueperella bialowiezensis]|uniref:Sec-independent protein translocase protein TatA n=1 Tax=Trueperella bialowiezensis TaxID=312285 RepID=A0A3S4VES9_9ACTO|nr:twin-arginine translocase TatA/TatE family subunit [Trueperella bialowiezensis]VEI12576.1 twin arginine translocase protein A [Trueperella bialowiezensis]